MHEMYLGAKNTKQRVREKKDTKGLTHKRTMKTQPAYFWKLSRLSSMAGMLGLALGDRQEI